MIHSIHHMANSTELCKDLLEDFGVDGVLVREVRKRGSRRRDFDPSLRTHASITYAMHAMYVNSR
jgi:hypothetical protein